MAFLLAPQQRVRSFRKRLVNVGCATRVQKSHCSPQPPRAFAPSFSKSLLALVLLASFFQQSVERYVQRLDGKLASYAISGTAANETRNYGYDMRGRLTEEPFTSASQGTQTASYFFDENLSSPGVNSLNGLGVRTLQYVNENTSTRVYLENGFAQVPKKATTTTAVLSTSLPQLMIHLVK